MATMLSKIFFNYHKILCFLLAVFLMPICFSQNLIQTENGSYSTISPVVLFEMLNTQTDNFLLINTHINYEGEIPTTDVFIPFNEIAKYFPVLPKDKSSNIVIYDMGDNTSTAAAESLVRLGYKNIKQLQGGIAAWQSAGFEVKNDFAQRSTTTGLVDIDLISNRMGIPRYDFVKVAVEGQPSLGNADTKLVMLEFSDLNCPFCAGFHQDTLPDIITAYVDTGKLKLVYRDYPIVGGQTSFQAAEAAECSRSYLSDVAFFEFLKDAYATSGRKTAKKVIDLSVNYGADAVKVQECFDNAETSASVLQDFEAAEAVGARGTPTFVIGFINQEGLLEGKVVQGALPFISMSNTINSFINANY